ncbi:MAG: hypothetical protein DRP64_18010 [Verrucomicrobia bacterium]|nr:MAG: hypothetical protein DRP64_18010 [Verrucomicrobiota bacterium]
MKNKNTDNPKPAKRMMSLILKIILVLVLVHVALFLIAGALVTHKVIKEEEKKFLLQPINQDQKNQLDQTD